MNNLFLVFALCLATACGSAAPGPSPSPKPTPSSTTTTTTPTTTATPPAQGVSTSPIKCYASEASQNTCACVSLPVGPDVPSTQTELAACGPEIAPKAFCCSLAPWPNANGSCVCLEPYPDSKCGEAFTGYCVCNSPLQSDVATFTAATCEKPKTGVCCQGNESTSCHCMSDVKTCPSSSHEVSRCEDQEPDRRCPTSTSAVTKCK